MAPSRARQQHWPQPITTLSALAAEMTVQSSASYPGPHDQSAPCLAPLESRAANGVFVWASRSAGRTNERPVWLR